LSRQVLSTQQSLGLEAWVKLLRGHASATRAMSAELLADHGLTINDYEVLLLLSHADRGLMRRVDLADELLLTASGVTRLLDGLERAGWVERATCESDRRVVYATLTEAGRGKLREASASHLAAVRDYFERRYSEEELTHLAELLGRLPGAGDVDTGACEAG
jgi:DNA-binding MarR family transcriptional regulator